MYSIPGDIKYNNVLVKFNDNHEKIEDFFHNGSLVARFTYYEYGEIHTEKYFKNRVRHKEDGPACVDYYPSGKVRGEEWYLNGWLHRTDGPADILYGESGGIIFVVWYLNGNAIYPHKWLRENGYKWPLDEYQQTEFLLRFA